MLPVLLCSLTLSADPLPPGALQRLGTIHQRAPYYQLFWAENGKAIFGGDRDHRRWKLWNAATGRLREEKLVPVEFRQLHDLQWLNGGGLFGWTTIREKEDGVEVRRYRFVEYDCLAGKIVKEWKPNARTLQLGDTFGCVRLSHDKSWFVGHENDMDIGADLHVFDWKNQIYERKLDMGSNAWMSPDFRFWPDGSHFIATESWRECGTRCFPTSRGKEPWAFINGAVTSLVFTKDGEMWMINGEVYKDKTIARRATATAKLLPLDDAFAKLGAPHALAVTPDDRYLIASGAKGTLVWDRKANRQAHLLPVPSVALLADNRSVLTCNGLIQRWELATGKQLIEVNFEKGHADHVVQLQFNADGKRLYSSATDGTIRIWDVATGKPERVLKLGPPCYPNFWQGGGPLNGYFQFAITEDAKRMATMGFNTPIQLWDLSTGKEIARQEMPEKIGPYQVRTPWQTWIAADASYVAVLFNERESRYQTPKPAIIEWRPEKNTHTLTRYKYEGGGWPSGIASPNLRYAIERKQLYDFDRKAEVARLDKEAWALAFSADSKRLAVGEKIVAATPANDSWQLGIGVIDVPSLKRIATLELAERRQLRQVAFDPRPGTRLLVATDAGLLWWDADAKKVLWRNDWSEQISPPTVMTVSLDGVVATGHQDGTILLWKLPELRTK